MLPNDTLLTSLKRYNINVSGDLLGGLQFIEEKIINGKTWFIFEDSDGYEVPINLSYVGYFYEQPMTEEEIVANEESEIVNNY